MAELTPTGLEIRTLTEIQDEYNTRFRSDISPTLNLGSTSPLGEYIGISADLLRQLEEAMLAIWSSWDVNQASGAALDRLAALTGTYRRGATFGTAAMTITLAAGTYGPGTLVVYKAGDPTVQLANDANIIQAAPGTLTNVPFTATTAGEFSAAAGTLTQIANPIVGFSAPTNPAAAVSGLAAETDAELRARREAELARKGSATVDSIRADILAAEDDNGEPIVTAAIVVENDTDDYVGLQPPHSIHVIVDSTATDAEIAELIFQYKVVGIQAYGDTVVAVTDSQGHPHNIGFSRPDDVTVYMTLDVSHTTGDFEGAASLSAYIAQVFPEYQQVGYDVLISRYTQLVMDRPGVVDVVVKVGTSPSPAGTTNLVIGPTEVARLAVSNPVVNATATGGVP